MKKRSLSEWASIAQIVGTLAVVVSLLTVAYTIDRNTKSLSRQGVDQLYDAWRELALLMVADSDLANLHKHALRDFPSLDEKERARYEQLVIIALDTWEKAIHAEEDGLIAHDDIEPWHDFYAEWVRRRLNRGLWDEIKWNWRSRELHERVESALADS